MQWTGTWHTKTWSRRSFATVRATWCICVNPDLRLQLWRNFLIRNSMNMKMMRNFITVSRRLQIEQHWQPLQSLTKNTKRFWLCYWSFNKTFLYLQVKIYQFLIQDEIQRYHWSKEYCKLHPLVVCNLGPDGSLQPDSLFYFRWQQPLY